MDLICTKAMTYNTRQLVAGDRFTAASARDARLLIGIRKARAADVVEEEKKVDKPKREKKRTKKNKNQSSD